MRLLGVFVVALTAACTGGEGPAGPLVGPSVRMILTPAFQGPASSAAAASINRIRLTAHDASTGAVLAQTVLDVDPGQSQWDVSMELELAGRTSLTVVVDIELIHSEDGLETVEWSGRTDPIGVTPGQTSSASDVPVYRGGLENLDVTAVQIAGARTITEGETLTLTAEVSGGAAQPTVFWESLTPDIATVSSDGVVTALLPGRARIRVVVGPRSDEEAINVVARAASVEVSPDEAAFESVGVTTQFTARVLDPRGDAIGGKVVTWTTRDPSVARSLGNGLVESTGNGETWVVASHDTGAGVISDSAKVTVNQRVVDLDIVPGILEYDALGVTTQLRAVFRDGAGREVTGTPVEWSTSDPEVVTVTPAGLAESMGNGEALITVTGGGLSQAIRVIVQQVVTRIVVVPFQWTLTRPGQTVQFRAEARDSNARIVEGVFFEWSSSRPDVATVDANGLATAVGRGTAAIEAMGAGVVGGAALFVEIPAGSKAFVANADADNVSVIDAATNTVTTIDFPNYVSCTCNNPRNLQINPAGTLVAVPFRSSDEVGFLDAVSGMPIGVVSDASFDEPYAVAFTDDGAEVWVANKKGGGSSVGSVSIIDVGSMSVVAVLNDPVFSSPEGIHIRGNRAFVANRGSGDLTILDVPSRAIVQNVFVGGRPRDVQTTLDGQYVYVSTDRSDLIKVRVSDGTTTAIGSFMYSTRNLTLSPDGQKIFVGLLSDYVGVVDVATDAWRQFSIMPTYWADTYEVAIIRDGSVAFVTTTNDRVYLFDPRSETPLGIELIADYGTRGIVAN